LKGDPHKSRKNSKEIIMVLLAYNANGTDRLSPLVIANSKNPCCFNVRKFLTKYVAIRKAQVTQDSD
jgi:hypothetical protein